MRFYVGVFSPAWLERAGVPLFVSHRKLVGRRTLPRAAAPWALDSGGYTELSLYGEWRTGRDAYVRSVRRYRDEIGLLDWAAPMDWLCTPDVLAATGRTVADHQRRTVDNLFLLRADAPDLPFIPVLQGWTVADYLRCADLYADFGIRLTDEPIVGLGSVAGRQHQGDVEDAVVALAGRGLRLHGFGVKARGLGRYSRLLTSADSVSWSSEARRRKVTLPGCTHRGDCRNCLTYAVRWGAELGRRTDLPQQLSLAEPAP